MRTKSDTNEWNEAAQRNNNDEKKKHRVVPEIYYGRFEAKSRASGACACAEGSLSARAWLSFVIVYGPEKKRRGEKQQRRQPAVMGKRKSEMGKEIKTRSNRVVAYLEIERAFSPIHTTLHRR